MGPEPICLGIDFQARLGYIAYMQRKQPISIDGVECWRCSRCQGVFPRSDFYESKKTWNGIGCQCKRCHIATSIRTRDRENTRRLRRESMRRTRVRNPEKFRERERVASAKRVKGEKARARAALNSAVRSGKIARPEECECCGRKVKVTGHHTDYSKPLDVVWLCYECHRNR